MSETTQAKIGYSIVQSESDIAPQSLISNIDTGDVLIAQYYMIDLTKEEINILAEKSFLAFIDILIERNKSAGIDDRGTLILENRD